MPKLINKTNLGLVDGVPITDMNRMPLYGYCSTDGDTAAKVVSAEGFAGLDDGVSVRVYFVFPSGNESGSMTLNVEGTGAYPVYGYGGTVCAAFEWYGGEVIDFVFRSERWYIVRHHPFAGYGTMSDAEDWSGPDTAGLYYYVAEQDYIAADSRVIISPIIDTSNVATGKAQQDAWNLIFYAETVSGGIKFYAEEKPSVAVPYAVEVFG